MKAISLALVTGLALLVCAAACDSQETVAGTERVKKGFYTHNHLLFKDGAPYTGKYCTFFRDSAIKEEVMYKKGLRQGLTKIWYPNGVLAQSRRYDSGYKVGKHLGWWPNGKHKFVYYFDSRGRHHGSLEEWYASGKAFRKFNYVSGREEGRQQVWKSDGRIKANYVVVNGERFGLIGLKRCYTVFNEKDSMSRK